MKRTIKKREEVQVTPQLTLIIIIIITIIIVQCHDATIGSFCSFVPKSGPNLWPQILYRTLLRVLSQFLCKPAFLQFVNLDIKTRLVWPELQIIANNPQGPGYIGGR